MTFDKDKKISISRDDFAEAAAKVLKKLTDEWLACAKSASDRETVADTILLVMTSHEMIMTELFDSTEDKNKNWEVSEV